MIRIKSKSSKPSHFSFLLMILLIGSFILGSGILETNIHFGDVAYAAETYTIYSQAYSNGKISPSGSISVPQGGSQTYVITPNSGYVISCLAVDGISVTKVTSYTFSNVQANHNIYVSFKLGTTTSTTTTPTQTTQTTSQVTTSSSGHVYEIWKDGDTYYASGGLSSTSFSTLWSLVHKALVAGDTVHFAGYTDYVTSTTIRLDKSGITITGDSGAVIRAYSSTAPYSYLFTCTGDNVVIYGMGFSGLGVTDGRDMTRPYSMVVFRSADNCRIENCFMGHTQQYILNLLSCRNMLVTGNYIRYGQNGISTGADSSVWNTGVIENNEIRDCSQAGIKIRYANGLIVRNNQIHLEYTYWKNFNHPGTYNGVYYPLGVPTSSGSGSQGIYFARNDAPSINCDVYGNTITDADYHMRISKGIIDGKDTTSYSTKSYNNKFHDNTVSGTYYGVYVVYLSTQSVIVYDNSITNVVKNICYFSD